MKLTLRLFPALAVAMLVPVLNSCESKSDTEKESAEKREIVFTAESRNLTYKLVGSASDYGTDTDITYSCSANMLLPSKIYGSEPVALRDSIMKIAFDSVGADFEALAVRAFESGAREFGYSPEVAGAVENPDGFMSVNGSVASLNENILSYLIQSYSYAPRAAHGMTTNRYVNYDLKSDSVVTLGMIFTSEGLARLPKQLRMKAAEMVPVIGLTELENLPSGDNFYLSQSGDIVFVYQPYEIASYAQGTIEIPIEPYIVSGLMTDGGRKMFGL